MSNSEKDINKLVSSYKTPFKKTKEESWNDIISKTENRLDLSSSKIYLLRPISVIAASLLALVVISWSVVKLSYQDIHTANSEKRQIILPDNSIVILNSDSYISYSELVWKFKRNIRLQGEAYFKVSPGRKFMIKSEIAEVQVLGTEFNTFSRNDDFETKCFSGKVYVNYQNNKLILTKGLACSIDNLTNTSNQFNFDIINNKDWRSGEFYFENKSLEFVFDELIRQFNVKVLLPEETKKRTYTGYFSNQDMEKALESICLPMQLSYKTKGKIVTIIDENQSVK